MSREIHPIPLPLSVRIAEELRNVLDEAAAGIWRSRSGIARTTDHLEVAQRFLVEARAWRRPNSHAARHASVAFACELRRLRLLLSRIETYVDGERTDLAMEAAELDRLRIELRRACAKSPCQDVFA
jgi:hypothetical protein